MPEDGSDEDHWRPVSVPTLLKKTASKVKRYFKAYTLLKVYNFYNGPSNTKRF